MYVSPIDMCMCIQDFDSQRDGFGLPARKAAPAALAAQHTQKLLQVPGAGKKMSASAKASAFAAVNAWETKELRKSFADPKQSQEAVKKAEGKTWATKARTQQLFNAAYNDEITLQNVGHMHPSEMTELRKLSPEYKAIEKHHQVTSATNMNYQPLRWMHQQAEPGAVKTHKTALKVAPARFSQLWNAGADDEVGGSDLSSDDDSHQSFSPRQWLASQHDDAEMRETAPLPTPGDNRVFREDADHSRNYGGAYVTDNSIGLQIDNLKAPVQMLAMTDAKMYKGAEKVHADARAAYLAKHTRQADFATPARAAKKPDTTATVKTATGEKQLQQMEEQVETQEAAGMHALSTIDTIRSDSTAAREVAAKVQASGRAAYLAKHARASALDRKTTSVKGKAHVGSVAKVHIEDLQKKSLKTMSLEGEEEKEEAAEGEEEKAEEPEDEYASVIKELDDLRAMAMDSVGNLPESAPQSVRAIARGDYAALLDYLDQVAADT